MLQPQRDLAAKLWCTEGPHQKKEHEMSLSSHLQELKRKHESLETAVEEAHRAPGIDGLHIAELKKQKLRLKEEISRIETQPAH